MLLSEEELKKIITFSTLSHYDEKIKQWVLNRIANSSTGGMTEEELIELIRTEIENYSAIEII